MADTLINKIRKRAEQIAGESLKYKNCVTQLNYALKALVEHVEEQDKLLKKLERKWKEND